MRNFRGLVVWQRAHQLTLQIYRASAAFPAAERYGLTSQLRRAASSVGANIAEGCGHRSDREVGRYLQLALASASELEYHLVLAEDLGFLSATDASPLIEKTIEVKRMLTSMTSRLRARDTGRSRPLTTDD
jgi:four helix bundle protein